MAADEILTDTSDMKPVHDAFRRALADAPGQIAAATGDPERARQLASYLEEVVWLIHAHHSGEDELLYPLLVERAPDERALFERMDAQHSAVVSNLEATKKAARRFGESASASDGEALAGSCGELDAGLDPHLSEEEVEVLPIAARTITPEEWAALPAHAMSHYGGDRMWLPFGLVFEAMSAEQRDQILAHLPPPLLQMWDGVGSAAFAKEMSAVRTGAA